MISFTYDLPALGIIPVRGTDASGDYFHLITSVATIPEMLCYHPEAALGDKVIRKPRSVGVCYLNKITDFHAITSKCPWV
jgi:hypothetical protein